jgi:hypothetical protein
MTFHNVQLLTNANQKGCALFRQERWFQTCWPRRSVARVATANPQHEHQHVSHLPALGQGTRSIAVETERLWFCRVSKREDLKRRKKRTDL